MKINKDPADYLSALKGVALKAALDRSVKYMSLSINELESKVHLTEMDYFIKNAFWNEIRKYDAGLVNELEPKQVYTGLCTYTHWFNNILGNPLKFAWLLSPVTEVAIGVREIRVWLFKSVVGDKRAK